MALNLSPKVLYDAAQYLKTQSFYGLQVNPSVAYFVVKTYNPELGTPDAVVRASSVLEPFGVFGDEKNIMIWIFRFLIPSETLVTGTGPSVYVSNKDEYINTTYSKNVLTSDIEFNLTLSGLESYSLTNWPSYWFFDKISPAPITASIDANSWVNFTGQSGTVYTVSWKASLQLQDVGWKDDSFTTGWSFWDSEHAAKYSFETDGSVLTVTTNAHILAGGVWWRRLGLDVNIDRFPYVFYRVKGDGRFVVYIYFEDGSFESFGISSSPHPSKGDVAPSEWTGYAFNLRQIRGKNDTVTGISMRVWGEMYNPDVFRSVYWDYFMFANTTTPTFG